MVVKELTIHTPIGSKVYMLFTFMYCTMTINTLKGICLKCMRVLCLLLKMN